MSTKQSIRFYKDREVRAIWSDKQNKWYFSATDIVRAIIYTQTGSKAQGAWYYQ